MKETLDGELESLPTPSEVEKRCAKLRKQINDVDQKIQTKQKKIEELVLQGKDVAKSLEEAETASNLEEMKEKLEGLKRSLAEMKEEVESNAGKLQTFRALIDENKRKCADRVKTLEAKTNSLAAEENEIVVLKEKFEKLNAEAQKEEAEYKAKLQVRLETVYTLV